MTGDPAMVLDALDARRPTILDHAITGGILHTPSAPQIRERTARLHHVLARLHTDDDYAAKAAATIRRYTHHVILSILTWAASAITVGALFTLASPATQSSLAMQTAGFLVIIAATLIVVYPARASAKKRATELMDGPRIAITPHAAGVPRMRERTARLHHELTRLHADDDYAAKAADVLRSHRRRENQLTWLTIVGFIALPIISRPADIAGAIFLTCFGAIAIASIVASRRLRAAAIRQLAQINDPHPTPGSVAA
ncbi:MAG: hypothetical protein ACLGIK_06430 [Gemmatimonadota bacterium]